MCWVIFALIQQTDKNYQQVIQPPARPTELFYNKVNPLLKEKVNNLYL